MVSKERERIAERYHDALKRRYQRAKKLHDEGKLPHEIVEDRDYADAESTIGELQEESRALADREARVHEQ